MQIYLNDIKTGIFVFPILALILTLPYMIYQYRKYASIPFWKSFVFYTFIFYVLCAYFMVILPLPECHSAAECGAVSKEPCLEPFRIFRFFAEAAQDVDLSLTDPRTWLAWLKSGEVYSALFNVLLTLPLGMYAKYFFRIKWWQAGILGFCTSLFYELSQLTGLWGIYDYAYRLFELDDLFTNTTGCLLGYALAIPLTRFLPDFDKLNGKALVKGNRQASFMRRLVGFAIDMAISSIVILIVGVMIRNEADALLQLMKDYLVIGVFFMLVPCLTHGQTLGQKVVKLRIYHLDGTPATPQNYIKRYALLFWIFLMAPGLLICLMPDSLDGVAEVTILAVFTVGYGVWLITVLVRAIRSAMGHPFLMLNGIISNSTVMTTDQAAARRAQDNHTTKPGHSDDSTVK